MLFNSSIQLSGFDLHFQKWTKLAIECVLCGFLDLPSSVLFPQEFEFEVVGSGSCSTTLEVESDAANFRERLTLIPIEVR